MNAPLFSVVMLAFNNEEYIEAAVGSDLQQTLRDFELIVSDDGSTDSTQAVAARLTQLDPRIRLLRHRENRGPGANRNLAIKACLAEWISFLDGYDI